MPRSLIMNIIRRLRQLFGIRSQVDQYLDEQLAKQLHKKVDNQILYGDYEEETSYIDEDYYAELSRRLGRGRPKEVQLYWQPSPRSPGDNWIKRQFLDKHGTNRRDNTGNNNTGNKNDNCPIRED